MAQKRRRLGYTSHGLVNQEMGTNIDDIYEIHIRSADNDAYSFSDSSSGKSEFDEEYFKNCPKPTRLSNTRIVTIANEDSSLNGGQIIEARKLVNDDRRGKNTDEFNKDRILKHVRSINRNCSTQKNVTSSDKKPLTNSQFLNTSTLEGKTANPSTLERNTATRNNTNFWGIPEMYMLPEDVGLKWSNWPVANSKEVTRNVDSNLKKRSDISTKSSFFDLPITHTREVEVGPIIQSRPSFITEPIRKPAVVLKKTFETIKTDSRTISRREPLSPIQNIRIRETEIVPVNLPTGSQVTKLNIQNTTMRKSRLAPDENIFDTRAACGSQVLTGAQQKKRLAPHPPQSAVRSTPTNDVHNYSQTRNCTNESDDRFLQSSSGFLQILSTIFCCGKCCQRDTIY